MSFPARCRAPRTARLAGFGHMSGYDLETRSCIATDQAISRRTTRLNGFRTTRVEAWFNGLGRAHRSDVRLVNVVDKIWRG